MAEIVPPRQLQLVPGEFPKEPWAQSLVSGLNQFSVQTVQAFRIASVQYKILTFNSGLTSADSFPIDIPVDVLPSEIRIACVVNGEPAVGVGVTVRWRALGGGKSVRISEITGLAASTDYSIRLAME